MKKRKNLFALISAILLLASCGGTQATSGWPSISLDKDGTWIIDGIDTEIPSNGYQIDDIKDINKKEENGKTLYILTFKDGTSVTLTFDSSNSGDSSITSDSSTSDSESESTQPPVVNELTADVLDDISQELSIQGNITRSYDGVNDEKFDMDVQVEYNSDAFHYSSQNIDGTNDDIYLYRRAGNVARASITLENKKNYEVISGASWNDYKNPFLKIKSTYFTKSTSNPNVFEMDFTKSGALSDTIDLLFNVSGYTFKKLDSFTLTMDAGAIVAFDAVTSPAESIIGLESYTFHYDIVAKNEAVDDIDGPYPKTKEPEHDFLQNALKEISEQGIVYNYKIYQKQSNGNDWNYNAPLISQKFYISDDFYYSGDASNKEGKGLLLLDGKTYAVTCKNGVFTRDYYPTYDDQKNPIDISSFQHDLTFVAPEIFTIIDDQYFELLGDLGGVFGYYIDPYYDENSYYTKKSTVLLDENHHIKEINYSNNSMLYAQNYLEIGEISRPYEEGQLKIGTDTFLPFQHTFTFTDEEKVTHSLVVTDSENVQLDGEDVSDLFYNAQINQVYFKSGDYEYFLENTGVNKYTLSVKSYTFLGYYKTYTSGEDLLVS